MDDSNPERALIDRLLLGRASEDERQRAEDRLVADDAFFADLQDREDELADDHAHGRLAAADRADFERQQLATPSGRERLAFARAAARFARTEPAAPPWAPAWLPVAAAVAFALVSGWLGLRVQRLERARIDDRTRAEAREQVLARELEAERAARLAPRPVPTPALVLSGQGSRDVGVTDELALPSDSDTVVVAVPLPEGPHFASYHAVLRTAEGALVWEDAGLSPQGTRVLLEIPLRAIPPDDYVVTLGARRRTGPPTDILDRYFRVTRARAR